MSPRLMSMALRLADFGWYVFPLRPREKRPLPYFKRWEERATRDPDQIYSWWTEAPYNIGIAAGPSKLLVVDCDTAADSSSPEWRRVEDGVEVAGKRMPRTFCVRTP